MAHAEIVGNKIVLTVAVEKVLPGLKEEMEEILNNYPIEVIPVKKMSEAQNGLIHVFFKQFANEKGWEMPDMKNFLKEAFGLAYDIFDFKTSTCDMQLANEFIAFIIEFAINWDVNLYIMNKKDRSTRHILEIDNITQRYVIACLKKKMCAICGKIHDEYNTVELHHWKSISAAKGTYENDDGLSTPFISLCTQHHSEFHNIGIESFKNKYHIEGVFLNPQLVFDLLGTYTNHFKLFKRKYKEGFYGNLERYKKL